MKTLKQFLTEASGDKVGEPHTPLKGHTDEKTAFVVDDYPYGFTQRTKIKYWIEYKKGSGWRFVSQTLDPKRNSWNKPKASTYSDFGGFMFKDDKGFVGFKGLSSYSSKTETESWLEKYKSYLDSTAIAVAEYVIKRKTQLGIE